MAALLDSEVFFQSRPRDLDLPDRTLLNSRRILFVPWAACITTIQTQRCVHCTRRCFLPKAYLGCRVLLDSASWVACTWVLQTLCESDCELFDHSTWHCIWPKAYLGCIFLLDSALWVACTWVSHMSKSDYALFAYSTQRCLWPKAYLGGGVLLDSAHLGFRVLVNSDLVHIWTLVDADLGFCSQTRIELLFTLNLFGLSLTLNPSLNLPWIEQF